MTGFGWPDSLTLYLSEEMLNNVNNADLLNNSGDELLRILDLDRNRRKNDFSRGGSRSPNPSSSMLESVLI